MLEFVKKKLQHRSFPVNFLQNMTGGCLCYFHLDGGSKPLQCWFSYCCIPVELYLLEAFLICTAFIMGKLVDKFVIQTLLTEIYMIKTVLDNVEIFVFWLAKSTQCSHISRLKVP